MARDSPLQNGWKGTESELWQVKWPGNHFQAGSNDTVCRPLRLTLYVQLFLSDSLTKDSLLVDPACLGLLSLSHSLTFRPGCR
jgi:hypothetical protein